MVWSRVETSREWEDIKGYNRSLAKHFYLPVKSYATGWQFTSNSRGKRFQMARIERFKQREHQTRQLVQMFLSMLWDKLFLFSKVESLSFSVLTEALLEKVNKGDTPALWKIFKLDQLWVSLSLFLTVPSLCQDSVGFILRKKPEVLELHHLRTHICTDCEFNTYPVCDLVYLKLQSFTEFDLKHQWLKIIEWRARIEGSTGPVIGGK